MTAPSSASVWFLLSRLDRGGLERVQVSLVNGLRARGYDVKLIAGKLSSAQSAVLAGDIPFQEIAPRGPWEFPLGLWRAWRHERPRVVVTTSNDVACLVLIFKIFLRWSSHVVVTQHQSLSGPRVRSMGGRRLKLELLRIAMRMLFPHADRCIAVSEAVASDMRSELKLLPSRVLVAYNPVVTADWEQRAKAPLQWPWPDRDVPTIIFVGRFSPEKRLDVLLRAFARILITRRARLLLVGAGDQEGAVSELAMRAGLGSRCQSIGYVVDPLPYIYQSSVLVLCSDYEGFGNVLVEAMACGTQVVSTDCRHGPREILEDGRYGQLVPCGDSEALAEALIAVIDGRLWVDPDALKRRAANFSERSSVDAYERVIVGIGARSAAGTRSSGK